MAEMATILNVVNERDLKGSYDSRMTSVENIENRERKRMSAGEMEDERAVRFEGEDIEVWRLVSASG